MPHFDVFDGEKTVRDVGDLSEVFAATTHLEKIMIVQQEIPFFGHGQMAEGGQLVGEKSLPASAEVDGAR